MNVTQEKDHLPSERIAAIGVVTLVISTISVGVATLLVRAEGAPASYAPHMPGTIDPTDFDHVRVVADEVDAQVSALQRWGWSDRDAGLAEIPIEDAIDLLARQGARDE